MIVAGFLILISHLYMPGSSNQRTILESQDFGDPKII